jgi:hypothetical protein
VQPPSILIAEMLAGFLTAQVNTDVSHTVWNWMTDNEACAFSMIRGHSANTICDELLRLWIRAGSTPSYVTAVPSACQLADPLTRTSSQHREECTHSHRTQPVRWRFDSQMREEEGGGGAAL